MFLKHAGRGEINGVLGEGITQLNFDENRRKKQAEAGKVCEERERERGKENKKKKWEKCGKVSRRLDKWQKLMLKIRQNNGK